MVRQGAVVERIHAAIDSLVATGTSAGPSLTFALSYVCRPLRRAWYEWQTAAQPGWEQFSAGHSLVDLVGSVEFAVEQWRRRVQPLGGRGLSEGERMDFVWQLINIGEMVMMALEASNVLYWSNFLSNLSHEVHFLNLRALNGSSSLDEVNFMLDSIGYSTQWHVVLPQGQDRQAVALWALVKAITRDVGQPARGEERLQAAAVIVEPIAQLYRLFAPASSLAHGVYVPKYRTRRARAVLSI